MSDLFNLADRVALVPTALKLNHSSHASLKRLTIRLRSDTALWALSSCFRCQFETECLHDLEYGAEAWIAVRSKRFIQAFASKPSCLGKLSHASACSGDVPESRGDERWVITSLLHAGIKISRDLRSCLKVVRDIPAGEFFLRYESSRFHRTLSCHFSSLPLICNFDSALDVGMLGSLVAAT